MTLPAFFINEPIFFSDICYIYPPRIKDIIIEQNYHQYLNMLTITQEDIWDLLKDKTDDEGNPIDTPSPFDMIIINAFHDEDYIKTLEKAFLFFTREIIRVLPEEKAIIFVTDIDQIKEIENLRMLTEENFFAFQNHIRLAIGSPAIELPPEEEDPRVSRIKAKARERDRIKQQKGIGGINLNTCLASLCCMGLGINPLNIGEISYASMMLLLRTYQEQEKYRVDMQLIAGGADPKKIKPKYWIRNLKD